MDWGLISAIVSLGVLLIGLPLMILHTIRESKLPSIKLGRIKIKNLNRLEAMLSELNDTAKRDGIVSAMKNSSFSKMFRSAEEGDADAQLSLGKFFYDNATYDDVDMNKVMITEAWKWFTKSGEQGNDEARKYLNEVKP